MRRNKNPLRELERIALDSSTDIADGLRRCMFLGGRTGSTALRDWASAELKGYADRPDLPDYRRVGAPLVLDGATSHATIRGQQVPVMLIPDFAQERVLGPVEMTQPIGEIAELVAGARKKRESTVKIGVAGGQELVVLMNHKLNEEENYGARQVVERIYYDVSVTTLASIVDCVRTALVELVSELRAGMGASEDLPGPELTDQAVSVAVTGNRNRVVIQQVQSAGDATVAGDNARASDESESRPRRAMWWLVQAAAVAAGVVAVIALVR